MVNESSTELGVTSPAIYQITVKGVLAEHWAGWFNGSAISVEPIPEEKTRTRLTFKVRDQAELLGILNRLNSLNLPLLSVILAVDERRKENV